MVLSNDQICHVPEYGLKRFKESKNVQNAIAKGFYSENELACNHGYMLPVLVAPETIEALEIGKFTREELLSGMDAFTLASAIFGYKTMHYVNGPFLRKSTLDLKSLNEVIVDTPPGREDDFSSKGGRFLFLKNMTPDEQKEYIKAHSPESVAPYFNANEIKLLNALLYDEKCASISLKNLSLTPDLESISKVVGEYDCSYDS